MRRPARTAFLLLLVAALSPTPLTSSPRSLAEALAERFPAIRGRLQSDVRFQRTESRQGGRRVAGLRAVLPPADPRARVLPPAPGPAAAAEVAEVVVDRVRVTLPLLASDPVVAEGEGVRVVLAPLGARGARAEADGATIAYRDVYTGTDALHVAKPDWTEEYLHLRSPQAPRRFEYEVVEAAGATRVLVEGGQVRFVGDDGKGIVVLAPIVVDAIGRRSATAARWRLDDAGAPRRLALELDPAGLDYPLLVDPSWITTGSLAAARVDPIGILLHNGKVLVTGGNSSSELYDPAVGTWSLAAPGWAVVNNHAATLLRDGRVLACGGTDGAYYATCRRYDPVANAWAAAASMTSARVRFTLTLLNDGRVLAAGGEAMLNSPLASAEIYDPVANSWTPTGSMVRAHRSHAATLLADGRVLVAGGISLPGPSATAVSEVFDPGTGLWTRVGDLTLARAQLATVRLPDGRVLASGGGLFAVNRAETFDPATGLWTATANLLSVRTDHSVTLLPNGRVLAAGGLNGSAHSSTEYYNPGTGLWTPGPTMAFARYRHSATLLPDGRVLVAGGWNAAALLTAELLDNDAPAWTVATSLGTGRREASLTPLRNGKVLAAGGVGLSSAEVYDPAGGSWTPTVNNLIGVRYRHTATLLGDGQVLVAGSVVSGVVGITAEVYDPPSNRWSPTGSMTVDRYWHTATLLPCGEVLVVGGQTAGSTVLRSAERYNPKTKTWRLTTSLATGRWKHTATLLADGRVLVTGGWNGGQLASAEIYDPATESWGPAGPMTIARYHHLATLLPSGRVLISGGFNSSAADLFDPATATFAATGSAPAMVGFGSSQSLMPNGRVLAVGGFFAPTAASVYDPGEGAWTAGPALAPGRDTHAAALLFDGRVLVAGGDGATDSSTALFDVGRGESPAWRPAASAATDPLVRGTRLDVTGSAFQGLGEASSGLGYMHSATNYPLVQLRRLDNEQVRWLPVEPTVGWSGTSFRSTPVNGFPNGPAIATVFTNGIPGVSRSVTVECPPPTIDVPPAGASLCVGATAVLSVTATAPGSDCPAYQWRKDGVLLSDTPTRTGTQTPTLTITPVALADSGSYTVEVSLACSSTVVTSVPAVLTVNPSLSGVPDASLSGPASVCTTCLGGVASETHVGGGPVTYQWGYRTTSGGPITDIPSATLPTYQLNGADFPAQANYFLVVRLDPQCGAVTTSDEVPVTVSNTAGPADEVPFFTVTSRDSENVLEWVYPAAYNKVRVRYTSGAPCVFPVDGDTGGSFLMDLVGIAGARDGITHAAGNGTTYCYTIFVDTTGAGGWSSGKTNSGTPFATSGPLKWAFHSGMFSTTAPTVGGPGVVAVNNDNAVHAMTRGPAGGAWPAGWKPLKLGGAVQGRSPIIPLPFGGSSQVMFLGAQDGNVYAIDAAAGGAAASPWPGPTAAGGLVQAAPAGIFTGFLGAFDYLLVGTREAAADNVFRAFDPADGSLVGSFDNGGGPNGIGIISSMAAVDYAARRVYFTSRARLGGSANTLWCLDLSGSAPFLSLAWARDDLGDIDSAPVLRGGRVYVGTLKSGGTLYSIDAATGSSALDRTFFHGDGPVKGFVFPDRSSPTGDLYFAANTRVWGVTEIGSVLADKLGGGIVLPGGTAPSTLLFHPGSHFVYVGGANGWLYQVDTLASPPTADYAVRLGPSPLTIGAPSLDIGHDLLHVGSEPGTFFAVEVPVASPNLCTASCVGKPMGMACTTTAPPCSQTCDGAGSCN